MDEVVNSWSPSDVRKQRDDTAHGNMKIRSLNGNIRRLRGGGPSVWAVDSDEPLPATGKHRTIKIGSLVSIDFSTDSAVFEIFPNIKIDPLSVALSSGDDKIVKIKRPSPFTPIPEEVPFGSQLIMYGAARRGMIGVRVPRRGENDDNQGSMEPTGQTRLTFSGDCGALTIDAQGRPWSMHTTIQGVPGNNPTTWTSHGALFCKVVDAHAFYKDSNLLRLAFLARASPSLFR
ncbi:expressed unknown protein [Seminavis robusta]|uniref:Uncharacterized protein n=1 Tax=Seminavis robusta TaxID=568900 RepID=A0A9N8F0P2_9STRA|nr:expressed unknown protein [Seminavis robusta]|eukprot:Sro2859_g338790.1 n/a (232) ;mRNA; f:6590-7403